MGAIAFIGFQQGWGRCFWRPAKQARLYGYGYRGTYHICRTRVKEAVVPVSGDARAF